MADTKITSMATHSSLVAGDYFVVVDNAGGDTNTVLFSEIESSLNHDNLAGFDAAEHFTEASIDHGNLAAASLLDDDHSIYLLLAGRAGSQTAIFGTGASENAVIQTTSNATKGAYIFSDSVTLTSVGANCAALGGASLVFNCTGIGNVILGGSAGEIQCGGGKYNGLVGGNNNEINNSSTSCNANFIGGGSLVRMNACFAENASIGGRGASFTGSQERSVSLGGTNLKMTSSESVVCGASNDAAHDNTFIGGKGGQTTAQYDFCWANYDTAVTYSTAAVHFRVAGDTADVHIGRQIDNATAGSNTNTLKLHTVNASNQSNFAGHVADASMTSSGTYTWGAASLTGPSGGMTIIGGTGASDNLYANSTSNATKGGFFFSDGYTLTASGTSCGIFGGGSTGTSPTHVMNTSGGDNVIIGGSRSTISGSGLGAAIVGGYWNTASGNYAFIAGGYKNTASGQNSFAAGRENTVSQSNAFAAGLGNSVNKSAGACFGQYGSPDNTGDFVWANADTGTSATNANNAFKLDGTNGNVSIGRYIDNATAGSNTNILKLHTTNTSNQSNYYGIRCDPAATTSGTQTMGIKTGTLTGAEIRDLHNTPVTLIPAPGAGKWIEVEHVEFFYDYDGVQAYDSVDPGDDWTVRYNTSGSEVFQLETNNFLNATQDEHRMVHSEYSAVAPGTAGGYDVSTFAAGYAVEIVGQGAVVSAATTTSGDSPVKYRVHYEVYDLLT